MNRQKFFNGKCRAARQRSFHRHCNWRQVAALAAKPESDIDFSAAATIFSAYIA